MKKRFGILLLALSICLTSCFDVEETYNFNADGSYTLAYKLDMGSLLGVANMLLPDSIKNSPSYNLKKDSVFKLSNLPDSVKLKLDPKEHNILANTDMRTQMDLPRSVFKINLTTQGKSPEDLKYFLKNYGKTLQKSNLNTMIMNPPGGSKTSSLAGSEAFGGEEPDLPFKNEEYDYIVTSKSFERKIRPDILSAASQKNSELYTMMKGMNLKMHNTIIINLPRPAVSVENANAVLSADRKQFKLVIDLMEATAHPEILNFKVNY